jgi:hypothetical protein
LGGGGGGEVGVVWGSHGGGIVTDGGGWLRHGAKRRLGRARVAQEGAGSRRCSE